MQKISTGMVPVPVYNYVFRQSLLFYVHFLISSFEYSLSSCSVNSVDVSFHIASVVYTLSTPFLEELNSCATDFKEKSSLYQYTWQFLIFFGLPKSYFFTHKLISVRTLNFSELHEQPGSIHHTGCNRDGVRLVVCSLNSLKFSLKGPCHKSYRCNFNEISASQNNNFIAFQVLFSAELSHTSALLAASLEMTSTIGPR
jgi:hypothetical protein